MDESQPYTYRHLTQDEVRNQIQEELRKCEREALSREIQAELNRVNAGILRAEAKAGKKTDDGKIRQAYNLEIQVAKSEREAEAFRKTVESLELRYADVLGTPTEGE